MNIVYQNRVVQLVDVSTEFLHEPVYYKKGWSKTSGMFVRPRVALALKEAERKLGCQYRLFLFDAGRSYETQVNMVEAFRTAKLISEPNISDEELAFYVSRYTSTPQIEVVRLDSHRAGGAVDLGLAWRETGNLLPMGTEFDELDDKSAQYYYTERTVPTKKEMQYETNRSILRTAMLAAGFGLYGPEWWHFDYLGDEEEIMAMAQNV